MVIDVRSTIFLSPNITKRFLVGANISDAQHLLTLSGGKYMVKPAELPAIRSRAAETGRKLTLICDE